MRSAAVRRISSRWRRRRRVAHARRPAMAPLRVAASRSHRDARTDAFMQRMGRREPMPLGSSLKFCRLAEGGMDVYPRFGPTSEWDTAAGQCVLEAAGGIVLDPRGRPLRYNQRDTMLNGDFLALGDPATAVAGAGCERAWATRATSTRLLAIMARLRDPATRLPVGHRSRPSPRSRRTRSRKPTKSPTRSTATTWPTCATNSATCCCRSSSMRAWRRKHGAFDFDDVVAAICDKMLRRHPHVFADAQRRQTPMRRRSAWEEHKRARARGGRRCRHVGARRHRARPAGMAARDEAAAARGARRLRLAGPGAGDREAARGNRGGPRRVRRRRARPDDARRATGSRTKSATCCSSAPTWRGTRRSIPALRCAARTSSSSGVSARWRRWRQPKASRSRRSPWRRRTATGTAPRREEKACSAMSRRPLRQLPRFLSVLPGRARQPHLASAAFHRQLRRAGVAGHRRDRAARLRGGCWRRWCAAMGLRGSAISSSRRIGRRRSGIRCIRSLATG